MRFPCGLPLCLAALLLAPVALADPISPNATTPLGPGFLLYTSPATPGIPGFVAPNVFVGITGGSLPTVQTLDMTNAGAPVLDSVLQPAPAPDALQNFSIFLGMVVPPSTAPQFNFGLPATGPDPNGNYRWTATYAQPGGTATFIGNFNMNTPGGVITAWSVSQPPDPDPGRSSFEIDFTVMPTAMAIDPVMTFTLNEELNGQNTPLDFTPVPEPASCALLACGAAALVAMRRFAARSPQT